MSPMKFAVVLLLALACGLAAAAGSSRVALVIGNASYRDAPLDNPVNDARAMAQVLRDAGFRTTLLTNASQRGMVDALREFGDRLGKASTGVFYFAGHGMQIKGRNYLVPVDAQIQREDEVPYMTVDAQAVLDKMESARNTSNLLILDACRNNPFARSFRSSSQGLAPMDAPVGTLVAFATAPGSVASDGSGTNGLYTQHLLRELRVPGARIEDVFKRVRTAVRRDSEGRQIPWEATSLEGDLVMFAAPALAAPTVVAAAPSPTVAATAPVYRVGDHWRFQTTDRRDPTRSFQHELRVARLLPGGAWETQGGARFDAAGRNQRLRLSSGEWREWNPHGLRWWPGLQAGEKRSFRIETVTTPASGEPYRQVIEAEARVVGLETVRVPAGEFTAWRIDYKGSTTRLAAPGFGTFTSTVWYAPELRYYVAFESRSNWNGAPGEDFREELLSFREGTPPR